MKDINMYPPYNWENNLHNLLPSFYFLLSLHIKRNEQDKDY